MAFVSRDGLLAGTAIAALIAATTFALFRLGYLGQDQDEQHLVEAVSTAQALKSSLNDPSSLIIDEMILMTSGSFCMTYRAKDPDGTLVKAYAVTDYGRIFTMGASDFIELWKQHCDGKKGRSILVSNVSMTSN